MIMSISLLTKAKMFNINVNCTNYIVMKPNIVYVVTYDMFSMTYDINRGIPTEESLALQRFLGKAKS